MRPCCGELAELQRERKTSAEWKLSGLFELASHIDGLFEVGQTKGRLLLTSQSRSFADVGVIHTSFEPLASTRTLACSIHL